LAASVETTGSIPLPRTKPANAATYQIASAAARPTILNSPTTKLASIDPKPQTPADIINAHGFWGDELATPKQATPAQVAALAARNAFASADPQITASLPADSQALGYAAVPKPLNRSNIVAASAPIPPSLTLALPARRAMATEIKTIAAEITTIATKGHQDRALAIANAARISMATNIDNVWMRAMIVAPSASTALRATWLGDQDMTVMRHLFAKPSTAIAMSFSDDPQMGITSDRFSGAAITPLTTTAFTIQTASLR